MSVIQEPVREEPWEHPDWYDLHDTAFSAGSEREPEHYRELILSLPPLGADDQVLDVGAGTGKLSAMVAAAYREVGRVTLVEPNAEKLRRAVERLSGVLSSDRVAGVPGGLGDGPLQVSHPATIALLGSVLMPTMELRGGTLREGVRWVGQALGELRDALRPSGWLYALETLKLPWHSGGLDGAVRRLALPELLGLVSEAGFRDVEVVYRFRDRVIVKGRR